MFPLCVQCPFILKGAAGIRVAERTVSMLSHKTKRGGTEDMIVWRSLVAWILVDTKIQQENLKNLGRGAKEINLGGAVKKSLVQKVVRPQALEGALKPPTFIYHFLNQG